MKIIDRERLANVVRARRTTLGRSREQVRELTGLAPNTLRRIEEGEEVRDMSIGQLDAGLDWTPGSAWGVAYGGEPVEEEEEEEEAPPAFVIDETDPAVQKMREIPMPRERQDEYILDMYERGLLPSVRPKRKTNRESPRSRRAG